MHAYIYTYLYSAKNHEVNRKHWHRLTTWWKHIGRGFSWRLNIDTLFVEQMCTSRECKVDPVETEKAREETVA